MDYAEYVGEDPAALPRHRWEVEYEQRSTEEREEGRQQWGNYDGGRGRRRSGGGGPAAAVFWSLWSGIGFWARGSGCLECPWPRPIPPYMGGQALGRPSPSPSRLGVGVGFLPVSSPISKPKGREFEFYPNWLGLLPRGCRRPGVSPMWPQAHGGTSPGYRCSCD
jgi:hypothetical protein